ncbi:MAG TPA: SAM-dependent methyltransferase, partial [Promineifilum sp.]|nr:SAM-dependent methyltransferase [Promineifilum sp.]
MRSVEHTCPACGSAEMHVFYEVDDVPVNSVLLVANRDEALNFQTGTITLAVCPACGFISNIT